MGVRRFLRRHRKRSSTSLASPPATPVLAAKSHMEDLERVFNKFDSNGDGRISSLELAAVFDSLGDPLTEEELASMMAEADVDGDGFISLDEFMDLNTKKVDSGETLEYLRHAFGMFDIDHNGSISADELSRVLRSLGEEVTMAQCKKMIDGVDRDGDGLVDFEEFKVMMSGNPVTAGTMTGDKFVKK